MPSSWAGAERDRVIKGGGDARAGEKVVFVIGGAEIYAAALPIADALVLTEIQRDYEGDTLFPAWDRGAWRVMRKEEHTSAAGLRFDVVRYERA
jgi:dihydrofolate reductase